MTTTSTMPGPVMLDVAGLSLSAEERERLMHPLVGGLILFARNFESVSQLCALTHSISATRPDILIAVDHEGGRVQRFREGFFRLPPMRCLGGIWDQDPLAAERVAEAVGYVLAAELSACGVDLSFTPVLDLDYGGSEVIGDRAFHRDPYAVASLAAALIRGLNRVGLAGVGKHFPGHGYVAADSHLAIPIDERAMLALRTADMVPYCAHREMNLAGIMPAHVIYPKVDQHPAGFSSVWLQQILRGELGFDGIIFSDDLSMEGASVAGGIIERANAALSAGCDMVLVCNAPDAVGLVLDQWRPDFSSRSMQRIQRVKAAVQAAPDLATLHETPAYRQACDVLSSLG